MEKMGSNLNEDAEAAVDDCMDCFSICRETIDHCLTMGGEHASADHIRILMDCSQMNTMTADFLLRGSSFASQMCDLNAQLSEQCASSCEKFPDDEIMMACADVCRMTADSCRSITGLQKAA